jgi:hypothetical protein
MEINVIIIPEQRDFIYDVLIMNKVWINKNLGKPKLEEWNAKYIAQYWLEGPDNRGVNRIFNILELTENEDAYEIKLGNSFVLSENWLGLDETQVRRYQYVSLSVFKLREKAKGILVPITTDSTVESSQELSKPKYSFFNEFWIGENTDISKYWKAYYQGEGYKQKFQSMECHVIEITFRKFPHGTPLFNLEPIYKTFKAYYYYLKKTYLSEDEFNSAGPLFLYEISRSSEKWTLLGELPYLLLFGTTLTAEQMKGQALDNIAKKMEIYKTYFGEINVREELFQAYMKANTPDEINHAVYNIIQENIQTIKISKRPVQDGQIEEAKKEMLNIKNEPQKD